MAQVQMRISIALCTDVREISRLALLQPPPGQKHTWTQKCSVAYFCAFLLLPKDRVSVLEQFVGV